MISSQIVEVINVKTVGFNPSNFVTRFYAGECDENEIVDGIQWLVNKGVLWDFAKLDPENLLVKKATQLIKDGHCWFPESEAFQDSLKNDEELVDTYLIY